MGRLFDSGSGSGGYASNGHDRSPPSFPLRPAAKTQLRDYRLLEPLGSGGMGSVYRAEHTRLNMPVAIKVLPQRRMSDQTAVARFQREMRAIGQLDHPAIVRAMDAGEVDDVHFLAMELVDGIDLASLVRWHGPVNVANACRIIQLAAEGIQYVHDRGVIHRDIKPSNLMLTRLGQIKILDLGLALLAGLHGTVDELTTVGQLMGTLDYMAPEQCDDSHSVDARTDVYALGATLYKLLCGRAPYDNDRYRTPLQKLKALAVEPIPRLETRLDALPEGLADVVHRALAHERDERIASAAEFALALEPFVEGHDLIALFRKAEAQRPVAIDRQVQGDVDMESVSMESAQISDGEVANEVAQSAAPLAASAPPRRRARRLIAASFFAAILGLAGILIAIETNKGRLVIESPRDDLAVKILKSGTYYDELELHRGPNTTRLRAGTYEIQLEGQVDGIDVTNGTYNLRRGDVWLARIVEERGEGAQASTLPLAGMQSLSAAVVEPGTTSENASALLYEGKTFHQWVAQLRREQSQSARVDAIVAVLSLGAVTDAQRAAMVGFQNAKPSDFDDDKVQSQLRQLPTEAVVQVMNQILKEGTSRQRLTVLRAVEFPSPNRPSIESLLHASYDLDPQTRAAVPGAFIEDPFNPRPLVAAVEQRLRQLAQDQDDQVAMAAITTLVRTGVQEPSFVPKLLQILDQSTVQYLQERAFGRLADLKDVARGIAAEIVPQLVKIVSSDKPELRTPNSYLGQGLPDSLRSYDLIVPGPSRVLSIQDLAMMVLGEFGPAAHEAIPVLQAELARRQELQSASGPDATEASRRRLPSVALVQTVVAKIQGKPAESDTRTEPATSAAVYQGRTLPQWLAGLEELGWERAGQVIPAIIALRSEADSGYLDPLIQKWHDFVQRERDPNARAAGIRILTALGASSQPELVADTILDAIRQVPESWLETGGFAELTSAAADSLGQLDPKHMVPRLIQELEQDQPAPRFFALDLVANRPAIVWESSTPSRSSAIAAVLTATRDHRWEVRGQAVRALRPIAQEEASVQQRLRELMNDPKTPVASEAAQAVVLFDRQNQELWDKAKQWATSDSSTATGAVDILAEMAKENDAAIAALVSLLEDPNWGDPNQEHGPRRKAIEAFKPLGQRARIAIPVLEREVGLAASTSGYSVLGQRAREVLAILSGATRTPEGSTRSPDPADADAPDPRTEPDTQPRIP